MENTAGIPAPRLTAFTARETRRYAATHPNARRAAEASHSAGAYLDGVPMHWMTDWPMPFLPVIAQAKGASITDIDGYTLADFCLGDTGSMFGHSPPAVAKAIRRQARQGLTYMLPSVDTQAVGDLLTATFGDFKWQIATTASDANRCAIRVARAVTGRAKILVFNGCYHGTVDDVMVELSDGITRNRAGLMGQFADLTLGAVAAEFNDLASVRAALATGKIAAILTEPVMTNSCMVLPETGFHAGLRALATQYGALLIIDETHTISTGYGGYTREHALEPDIFVAGKCVAGGMPAAVWGLNAATAIRYGAANAARGAGHSGMGTTLSANPLQLACLHANLDAVMTPENYAKMQVGAQDLAAGLHASITRHGAPWHVVRVGARVEFICAPGPLKNGTAAAEAHRPKVERALHIALLNRGSLIAPFHNMMLISPATKKRQIANLIAAFDEVVGELFAPKTAPQTVPNEAAE